MARKRYSDEDVLNLLRQIELSLATGSSIETVCRHRRCNVSTHKFTTRDLVQKIQEHRIQGREL